jgi:hypothetical protein
VYDRAQFTSTRRSPGALPYQPKPGIGANTDSFQELMATAASNQIDPENPARRRAVIHSPPGMDAGITTD